MRSKLVPILLNSVPGWVRSKYGLLRPSAVMHFDEGRAWVPGAGGNVDPASLLTTVRASNETTLLPSSAAGASYLTFGSNAPAIVPGSGIQSFIAVTNLLLNSTAPVTQTTASLGTGTYTLWVNGSGTATPSGGTATITGAVAASNGSPNTFTVTVAGTVTVTKTGSLNAFQLQAGSIATTLVVTAGVTATQAADVISVNNAASYLGTGSWSAVATITALNLASGNNAAPYSMDDGSTTNMFCMYELNGTALNTRIQARGVGSSGSGGVGVVGSLNTPYKLGQITRPGATSFLIAGGTGDATVVAPTAVLTRILLGSSGFGEQFNGFISQIAIFKSDIGNTAMTGLAT